MERVVVLGRGGAGTSTFARHLAEVTGLPVVELDRCFWGLDLSALPVEAWQEVQRHLAAADRWVMDGELGPYDAPAVRLHRADTVVVLDLSAARCTWRAVRRSRERPDFWWWLLTWRWRSRKGLLEAVATHAPRARLHVLRTPSEMRRSLLAATS